MALAGEVIIPPTEQFGFCEGVVSADALLTQVADIASAYGVGTVYGYHDIVHNAIVRQKHEASGVQFVHSVADVPDFSVVVTSAHGIGPEVAFELQQKKAAVFDAACPLVLHTHRHIQTARRNGEKVLYIGHGKPNEGAKLHDEIIGAVGHMDYELIDGSLSPEPIERSYLEVAEPPTLDLLTEAEKYRIVSQTTLDAVACLSYREELAEYIRSFQPEAQIAMSRPGDVCRAVRNRQDGVEVLLGDPTRRPDRLVVVTDPQSKNGMGYVELGQKIVEKGGLAIEVIPVANAAEAVSISKVGLTAITASASTPDEVTREVAVAFGADASTFNWQRKKFNLADDNPALIHERITGMLHRQAIEAGVSSA